MNIKDVDSQESEGDMLTNIFTRQVELEVKYLPIEIENECCPEGLHLALVVPINTHKGQHRLKDIMWRIVAEIGEADNCLKMKPWKQTGVETDVEHYREELADAFHFFVQLLIESGINARMLYDLYMRKSEVNKFRQRSKY